MTARVPQARDVALNEMNFRGLAINTDETAITLVASDSGIMFLQNYASATTYTLPAVATGAGKMFMFLNANTAASTVITSTTALIIGTTTAGAAKTTLTSIAVGDWGIIVGDGTNWFWFASPTVWTITT
ncbi:hypothetical protein LCGC14_2302300 [marine sediment metagenome]|uniref:Uncharacterized protein n=1 Tax=marine sediment metagenome TaxID=412755 RepID=A0A0F9F0K2_9ZZZZ